VKEQLSAVEARIKNILEGESPVSEAEEIRKLLEDIPCLVPGEMEFKNIQKLLDFDSGASDTVSLEFLHLKVKIDSDKLKKVKDRALVLEK